MLGVKRGGGDEVKNCLGLEEVGGGGQCYEWIVFNPPDTLNRLSQAATAGCGMSGVGRELLDS